jgi:type II secretory pathway pseudopilin PulG
MKRAASTSLRTHAGGFTLIELVIFIVIAGVLIAGLGAVFSTTMQGGADPGRLTQATQIAQERMELILGRRRAAGFAAFTDPCPGSPLCVPAPAGYAVAANIVTGWIGNPGNPNYKVITVTVTETATGSTVASLTSVVSAIY